ncbi:MAG: DUF4239 domain-containing protein [Alphaproteobacteria bacterium]|nr:DUF4239 domain-containing protein [Alphaproteobacteria bacterium]
MDVYISTWPSLGIVTFVCIVVGAVTTGIFVFIRVISATRWGGTAMNVVSPQLLSVVAILYALLTSFLGNSVWTDNTQARRVVAEEARALDQVLLLAKGLPEDMRTAVRLWVSDYVGTVVREEWPEMIAGTPGNKPYEVLYQALEAVIATQTTTHGEEVAQTMVLQALNDALSARSQRIHLSQEKIGNVKWAVLLFLGALVLWTTGVLHHSNRIALATALGICSAGIAASLTLIISYDRPFVGEHAVLPTPLLHLSIPSD